MRKGRYPSDLTDQQWKLIKPNLPLPRRGGRPRRTKLRLVVNAILYLHHTGCPWRFLPAPFPPWQTVYDYFCKWCKAGVWENLVRDLHCVERLRINKNARPSLAIVDSQSVKAYRGESIGVDGYKRVKGRKRHILVDTLGIILGCKVGPANIPDPDGGEEILQKLPLEIKQTLKTILGDGQYSARFWAKAHVFHGIHVETPPKARPGHERVSNLHPKRWIVERTFAWFNWYRRLAKDYERITLHSESMLYIAMLPILLQRICP